MVVNVSYWQSTQIVAFGIIVIKTKKAQMFGCCKTYFWKCDKQVGNTDYKTILRKFHDFSIPQILCEINFVDSRSAKVAILTHLEALKLDFCEFLHFFGAKIYQMNKIHSL